MRFLPSSDRRTQAMHRNDCGVKTETFGLTAEVCFIRQARQRSRTRSKLLKQQSDISTHKEVN